MPIQMVINNKYFRIDINLCNRIETDCENDDYIKYTFTKI